MYVSTIRREIRRCFPFFLSLCERKEEDNFQYVKVCRRIQTLHIITLSHIYVNVYIYKISGICGVMQETHILASHHRGTK
jgi:hypothetical protein